jgi:hypothetical protein
MLTDVLSPASSSMPGRQDFAQDASPRSGDSYGRTFRQSVSIKSKSVEMVEASEAPAAFRRL